MTSKDAFKIGFLARCADAGLSGVEAAQRAGHALQKLAAWSDLAGKAMDWGGGLALATPIALGVGAGALASKLNSSDIDADDVKKQELIDELRHYARRARERQQARTLRV